MRKNVVLLILIVFVAAACSHARPRPFGVADDESMLVDARYRAIVNMPVRAGAARANGSPAGRIVCSEASPDVGVVISEAIAASIRGDFLQSGSPAAAQVVLTREFSEAMMQLSRSNLIQAVRDIAYNACTAYAAGLLTRPMYAAIIGGLDETIVMMEALNTIGGTSVRTGQIAALSSPIPAVEIAFAAEIQAVEAETQRLTLEKERLQESEAENNEELTRINTALREANERLADLRSAREQALATLTSREPNAVLDPRALGVIRSSPTHEVTDDVVRLINAYMSRPAIDSLMVACLYALDEMDRSQVQQVSSRTSGETRGLAHTCNALFASMTFEDFLSSSNRLPAHYVGLLDLISNLDRTNREQVVQLQSGLNRLIAAGLTVDGTYGARTREAVTRFHAITAALHSGHSN